MIFSKNKFFPTYLEKYKSDKTLKRRLYEPKAFALLLDPMRRAWDILRFHYGAKSNSSFNNFVAKLFSEKKSNSLS